MSRPLTPQQRALRTVEYAPAAVSGFAVTFTLDDEAGRPVRSLNITPRVLAKLMTQSYRASYESHPAIGKNPASPLSDPDFLTANRGTGFNADSFTFGFPVWANKDSDIMAAVTAYIASDKDAVAFLQGTPDRWGMKVNPLFKGWTGIHENLEMRDRYSPTVPKDEAARAAVPVLSQVANPADSWDTAARDILDAAPESLDWDTQFKRFKRRSSQELGMRALIGITSLGDARRRGLDIAALKNAKGSFVLPTPAALSAGAATTTTDAATGIATPQPGRYGLDAATAGRVASLIEFSARDGQRFGAEPGEIADGYIALPTAQRQRALAVARMVRAQKGAKPTGPRTPGTTAGGAPAAPVAPPVPPTSGGRPPVAAPAPVAPAPAAPATPTSATPAPAPTTAQPSARTTPAPSTVALGTTQGGHLGMSRTALPALLAAGVLAGGAAPLVKQAGTPGCRVNRYWEWARRLRRRG